MKRQSATTSLFPGIAGLAAVVACILVPMPSLAQVSQRIDLLPRPVRWQEYPADVCHVTIDRTGRTWFETEGACTVEQLKAEVEASQELEAPVLHGARMNDFGGNQILHFDGAGRIWLCPATVPKLLLGYVPRQRRWIEHRIDRPQQRQGNPQSPPFNFTQRVHESRSGRLYFADWNGIHLLDGDTWSYRQLYRQNMREKRYFGKRKEFSPPEFAEDEQGRVYVWSRWGEHGATGTIGFFVHDGETWRQIERDGRGRRLERIEAVIPLHDGRALVCPQVGSVCIFGEKVDLEDATAGIEDEIRRLGDERYKEREAAQDQIFKRGPLVLPYLRRVQDDRTDLEVTMRVRQLIDRLQRVYVPGPLIDGYSIQNARLFGKGGAGGVFLSARYVVEPGGKEEIRGELWLITRAGRMGRAPQPLCDWHLQGDCETFLDSRNRLWITRDRRECAVWDGQSIRRVGGVAKTSFFHHILGEDARGRIYFTDGHGVGAVDTARAAGSG